MFNRESYKAKVRGLLRSPSRPAYKQKAELVRPKRCHSNSSSQNKRQIIAVIDNLIHKFNDRRKAAHSGSDSASSSASSSSVDSTKTMCDQRNIKTRIRDSPRLILKSTQNYIRSLKRPCHLNSLNVEKETKSDIFFDHFNSTRVEELDDSSILKSLLDSQQYLMLQKSQDIFAKQNESSSSENSNSSCIIHDCSDDSDSTSNQTFVEHSDESCPNSAEQADLTNESKCDTTDQTESYKNLLARLDATYLKSPNSIVNKVQIPDWIIELASFEEENIQWESLDIASLELYDLMLQRIHKYELMNLIQRHEDYRAKMNEMLLN